METESLDILLVEDNINDAELTLRALGRNPGIKHFKHLRNGEEAINFIFGRGEYRDRNVNQLPKLIVLDLKMPKVDGLEVLREVRQNPITQSIPVVMLTSSRENKDLLESYRLGINSYVVKPLDYEDYEVTVAQIVSYWVKLNQFPF